MPPRLLLPERMDDPALPAAEHTRALRGLARLNALSGRAGLLWPALRQLAIELGRPLRVLDVATGSGDQVFDLARRAVGAKRPMRFLGLDISPVAVDTANMSAHQVPSVVFAVEDVLHDPLPVGFDAVLCSLFLHHLSEAQAVELLRRMSLATNHLVSVNDLSRSTVNRLLVTASCQLVSRSPVVHYDGPQSVRAAFTPAEARVLAAEAGLAGAVVQAKFPCRWLMTWRKPQ